MRGHSVYLFKNKKSYFLLIFVGALKELRCLNINDKHCKYSEKLLKDKVKRFVS